MVNKRKERQFRDETYKNYKIKFNTKYEYTYISKQGRRTILYTPYRFNKSKVIVLDSNNNKIYESEYKNWITKNELLEQAKEIINKQ